MTRTPEQIERLLDAIELVKADRRAEAFVILRGLINEDSTFEDAWMWMSLAVDSFDQSAICLDHVLRVNPQNMAAAGALYRLRETDMRFDKVRDRYRAIRDTARAIVGLVVATVFISACATTAYLINFWLMAD
jgi:hypothetical protein